MDSHDPIALESARWSHILCFALGQGNLWGLNMETLPRIVDGGQMEQTDLA